ncbi:MAG TPA: MarR family transcriptional regulator [Stellaceae bacterium]|nr:MarR family transcriptional regulator [Stellaceae bacterium]
MSDSDLDRSLGFLLHDIARLMRKRFDQRSRHLGMTRAQWQLLSHLARHEGINQSGLAEILEIEPITLARLVDRMVEAGWVERRPHPSDRRQRCLYLTAKARPRFADLRAIAAEVFEDVLCDFNLDERDTLLELLGRMRRSLGNRQNGGEIEPGERIERDRIRARKVAAVAATLGDERP